MKPLLIALILFAAPAFAQVGENGAAPGTRETAPAASADEHGAATVAPSDVAPAAQPTHEHSAATSEVHRGGSGGAHHAGGIPNTVYWQALNFALFAALLWFLLRAKIPAYFKERAASFNMALEKAERARKEAEAQKREIEQRLHALQASADKSVAQAKAEAEELRKKIIREAEDLSMRLKEDARRTAEIELQRAKTELREEVLSQAVAAAKQILSEKIADTDQKRLQSEFVEKIQVVR